MTGRHWVTWGVLTVPGLFASVVMWVTAGSLMPPLIAWVWLCVSVALTVTFAFGRAEQFAVRLLFGGRRLTNTEHQALTPLINKLRGGDVGIPDLVVYASRRNTAEPVIGVGRQSLLLSPDLIIAITMDQISHDATLAMVIHRAAQVRAGRTQFTPVTCLWLWPFEVVRPLAQWLSRGVTGFVWKCRFVVGSIAVAQTYNNGLPWIAVFVTTIFVLRYLMEWANRAWTTQGITIGDNVVTAQGLGPTLTSLLPADTPARRVARPARYHRYCTNLITTKDRILESCKAATTSEELCFGDVKVYEVPERLDELAGRVLGVIELPHGNLGAPRDERIKQDNPEVRALAYRAAIAERTVADQCRILNRDQLVKVWSQLLLPVRAQRLWGTKFVELQA